MIQSLLNLAVSVSIPGIPKVSANDAAVQIIVGLVFAVLGGMSVLFIILGASRYAMSGGDPNQLAQAKNTIMYAIIGLVVSASAFIIVQFILGGIING